MISFVFYLHSSRSDNLTQTLRLLEARETVEKEVVLVCNDRLGGCTPGCRVINMEMDDYRKPVMCNVGVRESKGRVVALMDSDRVMPAGYFSRAFREIERGQFLSCRRILNLSRPHSDEEIQGGEIECSEEWRAEGC